VASRDVGTGHPRGPVDDSRIDEIAHAATRPEHSGTHVALHQLRMSRELRLVEGHHLGRSYVGREPSHVEIAITGQADSQRFAGAVRMHEQDEHVLQGVRRGPGTAIAPRQIRPVVEMGNE
jgi:hypothetical protein